MSEAYIIDAIRTPRGKGKKDGSLHEVKPITLLTTLLNELQQRHQLDTSKVDDIVLGHAHRGLIRNLVYIAGGLGPFAVKPPYVQPEFCYGLQYLIYLPGKDERRQMEHDRTPQACPCVGRARGQVSPLRRIRVRQPF